jgi:SAM-dependent methyltransferase
VQDVVTEMYEHYPYPRWLTWEIPPEGSRRVTVAGYARDPRVADPATPLDVLVAGCGTGSKAVAYSFGYGARSGILGIDLSRPSLAFAAMMARRHGADRLEFLRMSLLELPELGRTFDIVECTGVLHHLPDPLAGARALVAVTRPGGVVHISLYSERARREVVAQRARHGRKSGDVTDDEVREFRWRLMHDDPAAVDERLCLRWDFFDLARCRDLLFHPLEHRYSIPQAVRLLEDAGLEFRGIALPVLHEHRAWMRLPPERDRLDPTAWDEFEERYPEAFGELIELWAVKPTRPA